MTDQILSIIQAATGTGPVTLSAEQSKAALAEANADGFAKGFAEACSKFKSVLESPGIKGDADKMAAAMTLIATQPGMAADAVASIVAEHCGAAAAFDYDAYRLAAADGSPGTRGLALPYAKKTEAGGSAVWKDFFAKKAASGDAMTMQPVADPSAAGSFVTAPTAADMNGPAGQGQPTAGSEAWKKFRARRAAEPSQA